MRRIARMEPVARWLLAFDEVMDMRRSFLFPTACCVMLPMMAQTVVSKPAVAKAPIKGAVKPAGEHETLLPVRRVSLYKNGVGFFEQAGTVSGNELVRIDFTTAQLNDVLQSLTAVDLGDGHVSGAGYNSAEPLALQLNSLAPGLGQDPTVLDFLQAMKGKRVEVHSGSGVFTGRLLNVEVRTEPEGRGSAVRVERRYVSVVSDAGGLRTFELTPTVEVRMVGGEQQEIGKYLTLLAASHEPSLRHLTLEDRGTGDRELHVSYISSMPAWKSSYRVLLTKPKDGTQPQTATLQGWAVVDNTSGADWKDVQLTLVSGAPQSFIQQISRPLDVVRPEVPMPQQGVAPKAPRVARNYSVMGALADPIEEGEAESVPMSASSIGGGGGVQVHHRAQQSAQQGVAGQAASAVPSAGASVQTVSMSNDYQHEASRTLEPEATSVDMDDLFEYKLSKPMTIAKSESATVPILQTELGSKRVTVWNPREYPGRTMRALWLTNTSNLTLDRGSFSVVEDGMFGGEGQIDLMHPNEKQLVAYAADEAVKVEFAEVKPPSPYIRRFEIGHGGMTVHTRNLKERDYTIRNTSASPRTMVLEVLRTPNWSMSPDMPPHTPKTDKICQFEVEVGANATTVFKVIEAHSHPTSYKLTDLHEDEIKRLIKESGGNAELAEKLQPVMDARKQLAEIDGKLRDAQSAMDSVKFEEKRIRENMAALTGGSGESSLSKRYADEMNAQEDKMADLHKQKDALQAEHDAVWKDLTVKVETLHAATTIRA